VVDQRANDGGVVRVAVGRVRGEEHVLLDPEVQPLLLGPVLEERRGRVGGILLAGPAQPLGQHERMVVIARQGSQGGMALHDRAAGRRLRSRAIPRPETSASAARAAASPGTPCTAPPGNAAALPRYSPDSGVR
jgi:hypothetical protein